MILTVTFNPAVDEEYIVPEFRPGSWFRAKRSLRTPGGRGINISLLLEQLGHTSTAMGFLAGFNGEYIQNTLRNKRITTNFVHIPGETRTNVSVIDEVGNVETGVAEEGPTVSAESLNRLRKVYGMMLQRTELVVLGGSLPPGVPDEIVREFVALAKNHGVPSVVDTAGPPLLAALEAVPLMVKIDHRLMSRVLGKSLTSLDTLLDVISEFHGRGSEWTIVSYRTYGNVFFSPHGTFLAMAARKSARSIYRAGDALLAGMIVARTEGMSAEETIRFAMATAWESTVHPGKGIGDREALNRYLPFVEIERLS